MTSDPTRSTCGFVRALVAVAASLSLVGGLVIAATAARWYSLRNVGVDKAAFHAQIPDDAGTNTYATGSCSERACNYLLLGTDSRAGLSPEEQTHFGSNSDIGGTSRADTIMLVHTDPNLQKAIVVSFPRDLWVDIPGHGTNKINAAYALGGPALATQTVKQFLGVEINHVVEVSFENFPELIDALGGVTYKGDAVLSKINGGNANGGYTLRLPKGETEIDGKQALALARTRKNLRNPAEDDLTRARRQQQLVAAMKDKVTSFETFIRLPWVSWAAPKAVRSDMSGPTLLGVAMASITSGEAKPQVLKPSGFVTLPDGGAGLTVDDATKQRAVDRLMKG